MAQLPSALATVETEVSPHKIEKLKAWIDRMRVSGN
jgi:hypothetical protein